MAETYLGDGVYADYDGWHVVLRVPDGDGPCAIFLDPHIVSALERFIANLRLHSNVAPA